MNEKPTDSPHWSLQQNRTPQQGLFLLLSVVGIFALGLLPVLLHVELFVMILAFAPVLYAAFYFPRRVYMFLAMLALAGTILAALLVSRDIVGTLVVILLVAIIVMLMAEMAYRLAAERKQVERALQESHAHFRSLFESSPVSLWEEDFSQIKKMVDALKAQGIKDFRVYFATHPEAVLTFADALIVNDANRASLTLVGSNSKDELLSYVKRMLGRTPSGALVEEICAIAEGKTYFQWEGLNDYVDGQPRYQRVTWSVVPGSEQSYSRVIVAIDDITESKRAQEALLYLSTHDNQTGLYNRAYFDAEIARLRNSRLFPVSIFFVDMDGLKQTNDTLGHAVGDELLRRAAAVLRAAFRSEDVVARIGGDEFGVLLPNSTEETAEKAVDRVRKALAEHNQAHPGPAVRFSIGAASAPVGADLMDALRLADERMYQDKHERRGS